VANAVDTVVCAPDDGWKYHPKYLEHFPDINKLGNVASFWIYIGILLEAHYFLHISRIGVKASWFSTPTDLTLKNCTFCPHCIYVFCIYLRTNSEFCPI
jgi:hypothetical protein